MTPSLPNYLGTKVPNVAKCVIPYWTASFCMCMCMCWRGTLGSVCIAWYGVLVLYLHTYYVRRYEAVGRGHWMRSPVLGEECRREAAYEIGITIRMTRYPFDHLDRIQLFRDFTPRRRLGDFMLDERWECSATTNDVSAYVIVRS
jgi:hypothetical protein